MAASTKVFFAALFAAAMAAVMVAGFQYEVGEERGWHIPTRMDPETYNEWAAKNRFRIGDSVHFKYNKDSVLVVNYSDYLACNTANPIAKFEDGNSVFKFDRSGFFYFISGQPGHCKSGQRLIIRVMHPMEVEVAAPAPSPVAGGDTGGSWKPTGVNATIKLSVVSYFMTVFVGFLVIFYLLV